MKFVLKVAEKGSIKQSEIGPNLIGFCTYQADKVASVVIRVKGYRAGSQVSSARVRRPHSCIDDLTAF